MATLGGIIPGLVFRAEHAPQIFLFFGAALGVSGAIVNVVTMSRLSRHATEWWLIGSLTPLLPAMGLFFWALASDSLSAAAGLSVYAYLLGTVPCLLISYALVRLQTGTWRSDNESQS
jgi:hypothetical protein